MTPGENLASLFAFSGRPYTPYQTRDPMPGHVSLMGSGPIGIPRRAGVETSVPTSPRRKTSLNTPVLLLLRSPLSH